MGKDWTSPAEMARESSIYAAFVLVLAGVAAWDVLRTLPFDMSIAARKRKWRWPMSLYFANRIFMLIHIFAYAVNLNAISEINCGTVVWMSKITDFLGTCTSSIILALRTAAVWQQRKPITIPLAILCLGQVTLWTQTMRYSKSIWNPKRRVCQIMSTSPVPLLLAVWSYTMTLDLIVMVLCSVRLWRSRNSGGIGSLLLRDGMAYFGAAFTANLIQVTLAGLALNPIMNIIAVPFTLVVSVIASTTVFRNVFTTYDGFSSDNAPSSTGGGTTGPVVTYGGGARSGRSNGRSGNSKKQTPTEQIALGTLRSANGAASGIEVHRIVNVDVERDAESIPYGSDRKGPDDDGTSSIYREDKKSTTVTTL